LWIGSGLAIVSASITFFFIPNIKPDAMHDEDIKLGSDQSRPLRLLIFVQFREYLIANGYDVSQYVLEYILVVSSSCKTLGWVSRTLSPSAKRRSSITTVSFAMSTRTTLRRRTSSSDDPPHPFARFIPLCCHEKLFSQYQ